jgi:phage-related protein
MTSPIVVGQVAVEVQASTKGLAKSLRDDVEKQFRSSGIDKALTEALGKRKIKVPVEPVFDDKASPSAPRSPRQRREQVPDADPLLRAFQQDVARQMRSLARQAVKIPVTADTEELRRGIAAGLESIKKNTKAEIPTEPADREAYQRDLQGLVREVSGQIKASIPAEVSKTDAIREARTAATLATKAAPPVRLRVDVDRSSLRTATSALSSLATAARGVGAAVGVLGGIGALAGAGAAGLAGLASAAGGAIQLLAGLAAAAATASGALLALPGAAAIAAAGLGALALGFAGIGAAIKASAQATGGGGGGGAIVDNARQIAQAQRGLAAAERGYQAALRESKRAQEDLNRARKAAVERIEDLGRALRGARLDERDAAIAVRDALTDLDRAERSGRVDDIEKAQLAYEQSVLALENAKDAAGDLADENADAAKRGVEGSDEVQAALERQQSAADGLASATDQLASAQEALAAAQQKVGAGGGGGGVDAFAAAMRKLAPAAQEVVRAIIALRPAWEAMQRAVQQSLFTGVAGDLTRLSNSILPTVQAGFVGVAEVLNGQLRAALAELSTANTRIRLAEIFENAKGAIDNLTVAVRPFLKALLDVSAVGAGIVREQTSGLGKLIADVSTRLSEMAESGQLRTLILDGLDMLKQFGAAAADVFGIVKGIFTAVPAGGGGLFALLDQLNSLVNSVQGQSALGELFGNLATVGQALTPVLLAVAQALGPVSGAIAAIAVAFAPTLINLVQSLGSALTSLTPAIIALAPLVDAIAAGFQPLADILVDLVIGAAPGLTAFVDGLVAGLQALAPAAGPVGEALGAILKAVAPLLPVIGAQLANVLTVAATVVTALASEFTPLIEVFGELASIAAGALLPVILDLAEQLLPVMADAGRQLAEAFRPLIPVIAVVAALLADRLRLILPDLVGAIADMVPTLVSLAQTFGGALLDALVQLLPRLPMLVDAGLALTRAFLDLAVALYPILPSLVELALLVAGAALDSGVLTTAVFLMMVAIKSATLTIRLITGVAGAMVNAFRTSVDAVKRMSTAIRDGATGAYNVVKALPGRIKSALGNAGSILYNAGKNIINGLIDGIRSRFAPLGNAIGAATQLIKDHLPFSPAKRGPLAGSGNPYYSGQSIVELLSGGVRSNLGVAGAAASDLAAQFALAGVPALAGIGTAPSIPDPGRLVVEWIGGDGDPIVRGIRDSVRISYDGSAQKAFGTGR